MAIQAAAGLGPSAIMTTLAPLRLAIASLPLLAQVEVPESAS